MRGCLVLLLLVAFQVAVFWLFQFPIPKENRDLVTYMLGQLSGFVGAGILFYFGTTQSSREKSEALERIGEHGGPPRGERRDRRCTCPPKPSFGHEETGEFPDDEAR